MRRSMGGPCYSARLLAPFLRVLRERGVALPRGFATLEALDPEARVPIALALARLDALTSALADADLGLLAGCSMVTGDCSAVDYAMSSAATVREAIEAARRYMRLTNESLTVSLEVRAARALLSFEISAPQHRIAGDFLMAGFYTSHVRRWPCRSSDLTCLFAHPRPAGARSYDAAFAGARLRFGAARYGFEFEAAVLDRAPEGADPRLHDMSSRYARMALAELPDHSSLAKELRRLLPGELAQGRYEAKYLARKVQLSVRTLVRRLEQEHTSYKAVLEEVRKELALSHLERAQLSTAEIAQLLGFSQVSTFHRAFKRWTGHTPGALRAGRART